MLTLKQLRNDRDIFNQALHLYLKKMSCEEIVIKMNIRNRNNLGVKGAVGVVDGPTTNPAPSVDPRKEKLSEAELKAIAQDIILVLGKAFTPVELFNIFGKMVQRGQ